MSAAEVLAQHRPFGLDCSCGRPINSNADWSRHTEEALNRAGVAVVELPKPQVWDGPGRERYWRIGDTTVTVDKFNMLGLTVDDDWSDDWHRPSADDFRELAAALLAAAGVVPSDAGAV